MKLVRNDGNKEQCVGHVPIEHSKVFIFFLKRGGKIFATVTGNKFFNIGLELPCTYTFSGQAADVEKLRTLLKPIVKHLIWNLRIKLDTNIIFLLS